MESLGHLFEQAQAGARRQKLAVHGWIYGLRDGRLRDLKTLAGDPDEAPVANRSAIAAATNLDCFSTP